MFLKEIYQTSRKSASCVMAWFCVSFDSHINTGYSHIRRHIVVICIRDALCSPIYHNCDFVCNLDEGQSKLY